MPSRTLISSLVAELVGTLLLVLLWGAAVIVNASSGGELGLVGVALASGLAVAALGTAFAPVSGGQFNPAVTIGLWLVGRVRTIEGIRIVVAQVLGGVGAGFALKFAFSGFDGGDTAWTIGNGGTVAVANGLSQITAISIEALLTAVLVYTVLLATADARAPKLGALLVGGVVTANILIGGLLTGAAMNPARWFGPALAFGDLNAAVVYIVGPLVGAVVAAITVRYLFAER
jgi:aquaporin Z